MAKTEISVPYVALAAMAQEVKKDLMDAFEAVIDSGQYVLGPEVSDFEREFAEHCQVQYAVGVNSGTCSLHLVLRGMGLQDGDEVITVPNSFLATAATVALVLMLLSFKRIRVTLSQVWCWLRTFQVAPVVALLNGVRGRWDVWVRYTDKPMSHGAEAP